jgi:hypothetical protein
VEVLVKGCNSVHNSLCFVYFIKVDEASRTNAREKVILPIEVRNKLRETQVITTRDGHDCGKEYKIKLFYSKKSANSTG